MNLEALDFAGKTVWVTGAHQGIGRAVALSFARLGAVVLGFDKQFTGEEPATAFRRIPLDLTDTAGMKRVVDKVLASHPRIDVLVNAAGILHMGAVDTLDAAAWDETFAVNVTGVFHLFRHVVPVLKSQRAGAVVTIGSNAAHVPRAKMAAYAASKAALTALSQCVALDLAPYGVRCNVISPGSTDTPMQRALWANADGAAEVVAGSPEDYKLGIPLGKIAQPDDIANLVVFFASGLAGHVVLQDVVVDGGATLGA